MISPCRFCGSLGEGLRKGTVASSYLSVWEKAVPHLLPWCQIFQFLSVCHWCLLSCYPGAGAQREWVWVSPCVGSLGGTAWDSSSVFYWLCPCWFLQPEVLGIYLSGTGNLGWGSWCGCATPCSRDIPPKFLSITCGCGATLFHVCALPTSLDGCVFLNFIVVRLPFNSISDDSEWWLFYILVVIFMWLCEEANHVCLHHHLGQKFPMF